MQLLAKAFERASFLTVKLVEDEGPFWQFRVNFLPLLSPLLYLLLNDRLTWIDLELQLHLLSPGLCSVLCVLHLVFRDLYI